MAASFSTFRLQNDVHIAYEVRGSAHLGQQVPIVLVPGMVALRNDWDRLSNVLARSRPVLLYDHRGMGDSYASESAVQDITIEVLARDLLSLLGHLGWKNVALCGWSMGGVIVQQMLTLPFHQTMPTALPFRPTHVFLVATRSVVLTSGLPYKAQSKPRTPEERKMLAIKMLEATFDPEWLKANPARFETLVKRSAIGIRPPATLAKQQQALQTFNFADLLGKLPSSLKTLVIHGELDQVIPFSAAQTILGRMPSAQFLGAGTKHGELPTLSFGHHWYEYFDAEVWRDVFEVFMCQ
uniref:AB hydrolase-1 domain-containing protein n=1 Tax=Moniliophthora roreri TaxID=221103 RepID=A0A0W0GD62_MONRR